ncbi:DUF4097 family beta strand repeat protein [Aliikangiella marina]|uniref:DUF4097 family beta strand repeat protein n=1 Tax=Aliikangiella marina TaxID=1712262 RepID=A0A545TDI2_9GAMM|nr:DUF4097 family beta strand repeat-containing protein [Aliikangiella marina]TQV75251.1 DUF4097 family beta strand repeat protein [Aliikangiella marina]
MLDSKKLILASMTGLVLSGCITVRADSINYEATETLKLEASDLERLDIEASAGFLKVEGEAGRTDIEVTAVIVVDQEYYKLSLERSGNRAILVADANTKNWSSWAGDSPRIDLTVKTPDNLQLDIDDGSGFIKITDIKESVWIKDGSGDIEASNLAGDVELKDGSGSVELTNIGGSLRIDDGSGDLDISQVGADTEIDDGSGEINLKDVSGKVSIEDGSGDLTVINAVGHVTIDDGSGDIRVKQLENGLTVLESGSGGLSIKDVKGDISTD